MARQTSDSLRVPARGDAIRAEDIAAIVRHIKALPQAGAGHSAEGMFVARSVPAARNRWLRCISDADVDPFSVVEVYGSEFDDDELILHVRTPQGSAFDLAVNEDNELILDTPGWVRLLTPYSPGVVRYEGDDPAFGDMLGYGIVDPHQLALNRPGPFVVAGVDSTNSLVTVFWENREYIVTGDNDIDKGELGEFYIHDPYGPKGAEPRLTPSRTFFAYVRMGPYKAGDWAFAKLFPNGPEVYVTECNPPSTTTTTTTI